MSYEYVLPDGTVYMSPNYKGAVKFIDGHFEPITSIKWITDLRFIFSTPSGVYSYKEVHEFPEVKYFDNTPFLNVHITHLFAKSSIKCFAVYMDGTSDWAEDWEPVNNIEFVAVFPET